MKSVQNVRSLKLHRITISKEKFDLIPEKERLLFIRFGHMIDEINALLRIFLWSTPTGDLKEEEENARIAQFWVIARVLTGKLYEVYLQINGHYKKISARYDSLLDKGALNALRELKTYFSNRKNLIYTVRNKYAFHYAYDGLEKCLKQIPAEDNLVFYLSQDLRNYFFCSADVIVRNAMLEAIYSKYPDEAQKRLEQDTIEVTKWLLSFLGWYMDTVMKEYFGKTLKEMGAEEIIISDPPIDSGIRLPYFLFFEGNK